MTTSHTFHELFNSARTTTTYKTEGVILEITEQIVEKMKALEMSKSELASKINVSAPYITKLLRGETNFTAESLVKVAGALNCDVEVKFVSKSSPGDWFALIDRESEVHREYRVWSHMKDDLQQMRIHRGGLQLVQSPYDVQNCFHESR